jgi:hypothetical protein
MEVATVGGHNTYGEVLVRVSAALAHVRNFSSISAKLIFVSEVSMPSFEIQTGWSLIATSCLDVL